MLCAAVMGISMKQQRTRELLFGYSVFLLAVSDFLLAVNTCECRTDQQGNCMEGAPACTVKSILQDALKVHQHDAH